jgi:hypothetical protein
MHERKTYFILPGTDYVPDDLIKLGQIIADPRIPYRALSPPLQPGPKPRFAYKDDWRKEMSNLTSGSVGIFAQALAIIDGLGGDISGNLSDSRINKWEAKRLETEFIEPEDDYIQRSVQVDQVQTYLKQNKLLGKSVYIITGIKAARTPSVTSERTQEMGLDATVAIDGTGAGVPVQGGLKGSFARTGKDSETYSGSSDFVFAYRLRKVSVSWRSKNVSSKEVVGADLFGLDDEEEGESDEDDEEETARAPAQDEEEIASVRLEKDDFGALLPMRGITKVSGLDDVDGEECLVIFPSTT